MLWTLTSHGHSKSILKLLKSVYHLKAVFVSIEYCIESLHIFYVHFKMLFQIEALHERISAILEVAHLAGVNIACTQEAWSKLILHDDVIKWKHFRLNWPFVRGIHRSPVDSHHQGQWRRALMFSLICVLSKQLGRRWSEMPSRSLWPHYNDDHLRRYKDTNYKDKTVTRPISP